MVLSGQAVNNVPMHPLLTATVNNHSLSQSNSGWLQMCENSVRGQNYGNKTLQHERKGFLISITMQK